MIHNAAILGTLTPIEHYSISLWYQVFQTNFHSAVLLTQTLIPLLKQNKKSAILFSCDPENQQNSAYWGAYTLSKSLLSNFSDILKKELEQTHITVSTVNLKPTKTRLRHKAYPAENPDKTCQTVDQAVEYYFQILSKIYHAKTT